MKNLESITPKQESVPETKIYFIRHSRATYATYTERLASDTPEKPIDAENQLPDLPEAGIELARKSATELLSKLDPKNDVVYIVSSDQMRAVETARVYADVARERGIEVVSHNKSTDEEPDYVRNIDAISLKNGNPILDSIFSPAKIPHDINWDKVSLETKQKYNQVRDIVLDDDRGTWGANFYAHADKVKEIISEIETPKELYDRQFKNIIRLAEFARNKSSGSKKVNVLAFGHENYMNVALEEQTGDHALGNTEVVKIEQDNSLRRI